MDIAEKKKEEAIEKKEAEKEAKDLAAKAKAKRLDDVKALKVRYGKELEKAEAGKRVFLVASLKQKLADLDKEECNLSGKKWEPKGEALGG